jgi:hypothetical protein
VFILRRDAPGDGARQGIRCGSAALTKWRRNVSVRLAVIANGAATVCGPVKVVHTFFQMFDATRGHGTLIPWPDDQIEHLRTIMDRIIPRDQDPSATDLGVDRYVLQQLRSGAFPLSDQIRDGVAAVADLARSRLGRSLQDLDDGEQDRMLQEVTPQSWFQALAELVAEGYYADPGNGGNAGARSWTIIGYEHRLPEGPGGPSPAETPPAAVRSHTEDVPDDMEARRPAEIAGTR